jgi:large subunit ribosomal protein L15
MVKLNQLRADVGARKKSRRVGRGHASGSGQQAGRGHKGQGSRSGGGVPYQGFEGGQKPLYKRSPKLRGFNSINKFQYAIVNIGDIAELKKDVIDLAVLVEAGLVRKSAKFLKILGNGELKSAITVKAHKFSDSAVAIIEKAKGKAEVLKIVAKVNEKQNARAIGKAKTKAKGK